MKQSMKWRSATAIALILLLCIAASMAAAAEDAVTSTNGKLEVQGQAVRTVMPDTVDISIGAMIQRKSEQEALSEANTVIANIIDSLKALNIPENQIKTSWLNVSPNYETFASSSRIDGYNASISLTVRIMDFELINTVVDTAVAHGANDIGSMRFSFSEEGLVYRQALTDAIVVAREKAETMAEAAGLQLGTLLLLRESGYNTYPYSNSYIAMDTEMASSRSSATKIMSGEIEISASVELTFEMK